MVYEGMDDGCGYLKVGVSESLHHLSGGVGARGITLTADDLVLGSQAQLGGEVVFGLGAGGVDLFLEFTVTIGKRNIRLKKRIIKADVSLLLAKTVFKRLIFPVLVVFL